MGYVRGLSETASRGSHGEGAGSDTQDAAGLAGDPSPSHRPWPTSLPVGSPPTHTAGPGGRAPFCPPGEGGWHRRPGSVLPLPAAAARPEALRPCAGLRGGRGRTRKSGGECGAQREGAHGPRGGPPARNARPDESRGPSLFSAAQRPRSGATILSEARGQLRGDSFLAGRFRVLSTRLSPQASERVSKLQAAPATRHASPTRDRSAPPGAPCAAQPDTCRRGRGGGLPPPRGGAGPGRGAGSGHRCVLLRPCGPALGKEKDTRQKGRPAPRASAPPMSEGPH